MRRPHAPGRSRVRLSADLVITAELALTVRLIEVATVALVMWGGFIALAVMGRRDVGEREGPPPTDHREGPMASRPAGRSRDTVCEGYWDRRSQRWVSLEDLEEQDRDLEMLAVRGLNLSPPTAEPRRKPALLIR